MAVFCHCSPSGEFTDFAGGPSPNTTGNTSSNASILADLMMTPSPLQSSQNTAQMPTMAISTQSPMGMTSPMGQMSQMAMGQGMPMGQPMMGMPMGQPQMGMGMQSPTGQMPAMGMGMPNMGMQQQPSAVTTITSFSL